MNERIKCPDDIVFGLDIGTRNIVGTVGYMGANGFKAIAIVSKEHETRAMMDGQIHDIERVGETICFVKHELEKQIGRNLNEVCIAAAGRVLKTITVHEEYVFENETRVTDEHIYSLDLIAVEKAHKKVDEGNEDYKFYCVGYTPVRYYLNDYVINNLEGHKAVKIGADLLATFLPEEVVDGLYAAVDYAGLSVANLTLEPIAAMNVAIPEQYRLLNIGLVDVGAGTSDICITRDGSIIAYGMIPAAGDEMTEIIAKTYLVDFASAEKIKLAAGKKKTITYKDIMGITQKINPSEVQALLDEQVDRITKEVAAKICELNGEKPVSVVFVVGGGGKFPGFTKKLAGWLEIPEERVALRGEEVLKNIDFMMEGVKKDPLLVTPIGICINYYNQKNNFIFATVNGEHVKLYDNNHLSVVDAVMQAGIPNDRLFPRRGKELTFTVDGKTRLVRGNAGEAALIRLNGKDASINARIVKNDLIEIKESTIGTDGNITIGELPEYKSTVNFMVNGINILCPKFAYVNGSMVSPDYEIKQGDECVMENFYSVKQLFDFMDIPIADKNIFVNNVPASETTRVFENFEVRYEEQGELRYEDLKPMDEDDAQVVRKRDELVGKSKEEKAEPEKGKNITVYINGSQVLLSGKKEYAFVDIFDFYPFDLSVAKGIELVTNINGEKVEFSQILHQGDTIDLFWRK